MTFRTAERNAAEECVGNEPLSAPAEVEYVTVGIGVFGVPVGHWQDRGVARQPAAMFGPARAVRCARRNRPGFKSTPVTARLRYGGQSGDAATGRPVFHPIRRTNRGGVNACLAAVADLVS